MAHPAHPGPNPCGVDAYGCMDWMVTAKVFGDVRREKLVCEKDEDCLTAGLAGTIRC